LVEVGNGTKKNYKRGGKMGGGGSPAHRRRFGQKGSTVLKTTVKKGRSGKGRCLWKRERNI